MASTIRRFDVTYIASGSIRLGMAVKFAAADSTNRRQKVQEATANTDEAIGIAQCAASDGQAVEVAHPGGGAFMLAGETLTAGKSVVPGAAGVYQSNASGDRIIGQCLDDAVVGDILSGQVVKGIATAADQ